MKLALSIGTGTFDFNADPTSKRMTRNSRFSVPIPLIQRVEELGFDSVWTAETFGADALTPLAFIAGQTKRIKLGTVVAQIDGRTPANLAMCAQTIEAMAGEGRMLLGLGVSGPQVVEGWYGRPWGKPNYKIRDTVGILRKIFQRGEPVAHEGREISLPYRGEGAIGLGKPLRSAIHTNPDIPIYLGTESPLNVRMTGEIADGWLGLHLAPSVVPKYLALLDEGIARRTDGKTLKDMEIWGNVGVQPTDDVQAAIDAQKPYIAFYVGGMGAKSMNFHKDAMIARGYKAQADRIQELFLAGHREEAADAVPDEYVDEEWLLGSPERIAERFKAWRDCGLTTIAVRPAPLEVLELIAKIALG